MIRSAAALVALALLAGCTGEIETRPPFETRVFDVFVDDMIHFLPEEPGSYETVRTSAEDNGREAVTQLELPDLGDRVKITARVALRPVPKDMITVHDKWDRAGHVRLRRDDGPDVEILRFMTAYGGATAWEADVSHLAPLLKEDCTFVGWIDTWVSPGWRMDFSLRFEAGDERNPDWVEPVFFVQEYKADAPGNEGVTAAVEVPEGIERVSLSYVTTGHCTDGRGEDEFEPKDNVIAVDGIETHRFRPWREDCLQFRTINPYCRRWSNGDWSSDFSRSGWCPGDRVAPTDLDLTGVLTPGAHDLRLVIEDVRPEDESGVGYWRVSGVLVGWER